MTNTPQQNKDKSANANKGNNSSLRVFDRLSYEKTEATKQPRNKRNWRKFLPEKWTDWLMVGFNGLLALFTFYLYQATNSLSIGAVKQLYVMQGQLDEMKNAGIQTNSMIVATKKLAAAAKMSADAAASAVAISKDEFIANQRAWIGPGGKGAAIFNKGTNVAPIEGKPISIQVAYGNFGREPAEMIAKATINHILISQLEGRYFDGWIAKFKSDCLNDKLDWRGAGEIYPMGSDSAYTMIINSDDSWLNQRHDFRFNMSESIKSSKEAVVAQGCLSYKTQGTIHHSLFCYFYRADEFAFNNLGYCPKGQYAD